MPPFRLSILALLLLPGCATVMHGSSQNVAVITEPPGAACTLERDGVMIGSVSPTPGTVRIDKGKNDILVTCNREGFEATAIRHVSEFGGATVANVIAGGIIGVAVDAISGANFPYPAEARLILQPPGAPPVVQPTPITVHPERSATRTP
jgi:hypothetical protein